MNVMHEVWKDVQGWERYYQVSNLGQVRSLDRTIRCRNPQGRMASRRFRGRTLVSCASKLGYPGVHLTRPGRVEYHFVHWLVAAAFIGPRPRGLVVMHKDETQDNNRVTNLKYGTHSENHLAAFAARK